MQEGGKHEKQATLNPHHPAEYHVCRPCALADDGCAHWMLDVLLRLAVLAVIGIIGVTVQGVWKKRREE